MQHTGNNTDAIRDFILAHIGRHGDTILSHTMAHFAVKKSLVQQQLHALLTEQYIRRDEQHGYQLGPLREYVKRYTLTPDFASNAVWEHDIAPLLEAADAEVRHTCRYALRALINNTLQHAQATQLHLYLRYTPHDVLLIVRDNGQGLLSTLKQHAQLRDPDYALLEISKGALTHPDSGDAGNSLCICARVFSDMAIDSGNTSFTYQSNSVFVPLPDDGRGDQQTIIRLLLQLNDKPALDHVMQQVAAKHCHIPVHLIQQQHALSRTQAQHLLYRLEQFASIHLDFSHVRNVSPAFANDIFYTFQQAHPNIPLSYSNANEKVSKHVQHALSKHAVANAIHPETTLKPADA